MSLLLAKIDNTFSFCMYHENLLTDVISLRIRKHVFILQAAYEIEENLCLQNIYFSTLELLY